jgi:putative ABC transport system permease protein
MWYNYLKIGLRGLFKDRGYLAINLLGLAVGVCCALLIAAVVRFELGFDGFHAEADRLFRVIVHEQEDGQETRTAASHYSLPGALRTDFPELVATTVRIDNFDVQMTLNDPAKGTERKFLENRSGFVEPVFWQLFNLLTVTHGDREALAQPNTVMLSEKTAAKFFGGQDPLGQVIRRDNGLEFRVVGVFRDFPANTDLPLEIAFSYATLPQLESERALTGWGGLWSQLATYVRLPEGLAPEQLTARLAAFGQKYLPEKRKKSRRYDLQPLAQVHFDRGTETFTNRTVPKENLWALVGVAGLLVLTACVNFINLTTARSVKRSREVGVRKVLGSSRRALVAQFMAETGVVAGLAMGLAVGLATQLLPYLDQVLGVAITPDLVWDARMGLLVLALWGLITLLSGLYPALVLSGFGPVLALKGAINARQAGGLSLRRGLVGFQFAISQVLVAATLIAIQQMQFFQQKDLGFDQQAILTLSLPNDPQRYEALRTELGRVAGVEKVGLAFSTPSAEYLWTTGIRDEASGKEHEANLKMADTSYLDLYGLQLVAGRNYRPTDTLNEVVVNEALVAKLGLASTEAALGRRIVLSLRGQQAAREIVGVVRDFHVTSLHEGISPVVLGANRNTYSIVGLKLGLAEVRAILPRIEQSWARVFPEFLFDYDFLDQKLAQAYEAELRQAKLLTIFAMVAVLIGCIGLYGLVSFMVAQKTKEIGVRKVLGATMGQVVGIFSSEFAKLLLAAFVVAVPVVYWAMDAWLANFAYRISLGPGAFALAILLSASVAALTVSYQTIRAALANPVKSLRSE